MAKKLDHDFCKAAPMLDWLGSKWALVVMIKIHDAGTLRFNDLFRGIPMVSEKVLSQVLKQLVRDGLISREIYPDVPPSVEYSLTALGATLIPHIQELAQWGRDNYDTIMNNRNANGGNAD